MSQTAARASRLCCEKPEVRGARNAARWRPTWRQRQSEQSRWRIGERREKGKTTLDAFEPSRPPNWLRFHVAQSVASRTAMRARERGRKMGALAPGLLNPKGARAG